MKTFIMLMLLVFSSTVALAANITITYPTGEEDKVLDGITKGMRACNKGELRHACAHRLVLKFVQNEMRNWENQVVEEAKASFVKATLS